METHKMTNWTEQDLLQLDNAYAEAGVAFHARPMRAAVDLLGDRFSFGVGDNSETQAIIQTYQRLIPEVVAIWPGMGIGLVASIDQVRKITVAVVFGARSVNPEKAMGFDSRESWLQWCRNEPKIAASSYYAIADLYDLTYGINQMQQLDATAIEYWKIALSNLEDVANILTANFSVASVIQQVCMIAELSMKASLLYCGVDQKILRSHAVGHQHIAMAKLMASTIPHRDDALVASVADKFPDYVKSRYKAAGLTRLDVVRLALGSQFIAASSVRRLSGPDLAHDMERDDWPGPRRMFFAP
jgi:hypothetical protein